MATTTVQFLQTEGISVDHHVSDGFVFLNVVTGEGSHRTTVCFTGTPDHLTAVLMRMAAEVDAGERELHARRNVSLFVEGQAEHVAGFIEEVAG